MYGGMIGGDAGRGCCRGVGVVERDGGGVREVERGDINGGDWLIVDGREVATRGVWFCRHGGDSGDPGLENAAIVRVLPSVILLKRVQSLLEDSQWREFHK